ncbi:hypothetical protein DFH08DRAFT_825941 [Mycena albidolilacea]|uniref:Uncharacterized protein n=1 Tax=Mycena albidolilacea TaxID=1033008 RepID=A0AAD6Z1F4_9AGAR|nr:hypothetical protein DFH08DRAFT_825941 [Mycena albidolilacea]
MRYILPFSVSSSHPLRNDGFDNFGPRLHFECRDIDILDCFSNAAAQACSPRQGSEESLVFVPWCDVESHETKGREGRTKKTGGKKVVSKPVQTRERVLKNQTCTVRRRWEFGDSGNNTPVLEREFLVSARMLGHPDLPHSLAGYTPASCETLGRRMTGRSRSKEAADAWNEAWSVGGWGDSEENGSCKGWRQDARERKAEGSEQGPTSSEKKAAEKLARHLNIAGMEVWADAKVETLRAVGVWGGDVDEAGVPRIQRTAAREMRWGSTEHDEEGGCKGGVGCMRWRCSRGSSRCREAACGCGGDVVEDSGADEGAATGGHAGSGRGRRQCGLGAGWVRRRVETGRGAGAGGGRTGRGGRDSAREERAGAVWTRGGTGKQEERGGEMDERRSGGAAQRVQGIRGDVASTKGKGRRDGRKSAAVDNGKRGVCGCSRTAVVRKDQCGGVWGCGRGLDGHTDTKAGGGRLGYGSGVDGWGVDVRKEPPGATGQAVMTARWHAGGTESSGATGCWGREGRSSGVKGARTGAGGLQSNAQQARKREAGVRGRGRREYVVADSAWRAASAKETEGAGTGDSGGVAGHAMQTGFLGRERHGLGQAGGAGDAEDADAVAGERAVWRGKEQRSGQVHGGSSGQEG